MASFSDTLMAYANGIGQKVGADAKITLTGDSELHVKDFFGALTGNASTASKWSSSRSVSFSGGDATGSFSIQGDADVSNVALTLASVATAQTNYGSQTEYISLTWDEKGRITNSSKGDIRIASTQVHDLGTTISNALAPYLTSATAASTYTAKSQSVTAGTGISLSGTTTLGTLSTIALASISPTGAGTEVGSASQVAKVTVDSYGRVTSVVAEAIQIDQAHVTNLGSALAAKLNVASPTFTGTMTGVNLHLTGNLKVDGVTESTTTTNLSVEDSFIDLSVGNTSTSAKAGGFSLARKALASAVSIVSTTAKNNVGPVRAFVTVGAGAGAGFAIDQLVMLSGTAANDGFYAIADISGDDISISTIDIDGTGNAPFLHTNLAAAGAEGQITRVQIDALAFSDGALSAVEGELIKASGSTYAAFSTWSLVAPNANSDFALISAGVAVGDVLHDNSGELVLASNDYTTAHFRPVAAALAANATLSAATREVHTAGGKLVLVNFLESAPAAGAVVYLSATAGKATTTEPSAIGTVIVELGIVKSLGSSNQAYVFWQPRVIAKNN